MENIQLDELVITVKRKAVKHIRLSVHPPDGRVTLTVPVAVRFEAARSFAISRLNWIRTQQKKLQARVREVPQQFVEHENHLLWGTPCLLAVRYQDIKPSVVLDGRQIILTVRPGASLEKRAQIMQEWHKSLLHEAVPPLFETWQARLKVQVSGYSLQQMKTRWGTCNYRTGHIRLNTELAKKPRPLLEYVVVHELAHLIEPSHNARFVAVMDAHYPGWRNAHAELNAPALAAGAWKE